MQILRLLMVTMFVSASLHAATDIDASRVAIASLEEMLTLKPKTIPASIMDAPYAKVPLTKADALRARRILWDWHEARIKRERSVEIEANLLEWSGNKMPIFIKSFGTQPKDGWSLWISLHGGGGTAANVNDQQWENQKRLYKLEEGIYVAPRAPTNNWNLWHENHIDPLFQRLIEDLIVLKNVNPNRVYILGYSAGGDGVYQLAPRMADYWAAAAMMAGHPNDASPLGLRNIGFAIQVGGRDAAYNRNKIAQEWIDKLDELEKNDPGGYKHYGKIHAGKPHWMDGADAAVLPWMAEQTRNPIPEKIVWRQSGVTHDRFYWLYNPKAVQDAEIRAERKGQTIRITEWKGISQVTLRLDDRMQDLDEPVMVYRKDKLVYGGIVPRTLSSLVRSLYNRGDPALMFDAELDIDLVAPAK